MHFYKPFIFLLVILTSVFSGCASTKYTDTDTVVVNDPKDPIEPVNRILWDFNWEILDQYLLRPVTVIYIRLIPQGMRTGVHNVALNLEEPVSVVNNLLQGHVSDAGVSLSRFAINSTVGLLGAIDVAASFDLTRQDEEFGEVLAAHGAAQGPFLMLPAKGPSDMRNLVGDWVDSSYLLLDAISTPVNLVRFGVKVLEGRALLMSQEGMLDNAVDPYSLVKDIYWQKEILKQTEHLSIEEQDALMEEEFEEDIDAMLEDF